VSGEGRGGKEERERGERERREREERERGEAHMCPRAHCRPTISRSP
jgi:hypothetical protein